MSVTIRVTDHAVLRYLVKLVLLRDEDEVRIVTALKPMWPARGGEGETP